MKRTSAVLVFVLLAGGAAALASSRRPSQEVRFAVYSGNDLYDYLGACDRMKPSLNDDSFYNSIHK